MAAERRLARICGDLLELLFPGCCLLCGEALADRAGALFPVCDGCLSKLPPLSASRRCTVCSIPLISETELCTRCRSREFYFDSNHSLFEYRGAVRELLFQYKFKARRRAAWPIAELMGRSYTDRFKGLPAVPVPGHPKNVRRRGWDPMVEAGRALSSLYQVPVRHLLHRGASREQKGLGFEERLANVRGTISLRSGLAQVPDELVLIDDIFTTGATASECARVLRDAGARRTAVLTLAIDC